MISPDSGRRIRLAVFDLDGTLLPRTTACQQIATAAGDLLTIENLERDYRAGFIDSTTFAERALRSWSHAGESLYQRAFAAAPKIGGVEQALVRLRAHEIVTCLVTMAPRQFAECFPGFDHAYGSIYPTRILNPEDKPSVVRKLQAKLGIDTDAIIAFGDSDSDLPLFGYLHHTVAVNSTPNLAAVAAHRYDGADINQALDLVWPRAEAVRR
ncbi:haloacid dehalogenase-like hydrolase [Micromonospora tulbaghiae]|uniref:HAD family hydrolase n=1 Tax=Micromonospora tulbaghiae TaxID=479978 RepID=UPI0033D8323A